MNRSFFLLFVFLFISVPQAWSQDLDRLVERVTGLWQERGRGDAARAAQFVDPVSRKAFPMYDMAREAQVDSIQFSGDRTKVLVAVKVKATLPGIGDVRQTLVETWVWSNGNWYVRPESAENPFDALAKDASAKPVTFKMELLNRKLELGSYRQGELISGTLDFRAPRAQLDVIRARGIPGLRIRRWDWKDDNNGTIHFTIDTSLLSENVSQEVVFDAVGPMVGLERLSSTDRAVMTAQIQGRVRVLQLPATDAAKRDGLVEVEIRNVSDARFTITGVRHGSSVTVDEKANGLQLDPGQSVVVPIQYTSKTVQDDAEITFLFSPGVMPANSLIFRLAGTPAAKQDDNVPGGVTRAQVEELIKQQNPQIQQLQKQTQQPQNPR